jgi:hypothetical protein
MRGRNHAFVGEEKPQDAIVPDGFLVENIERCRCQQGRAPQVLPLSVVDNSDFLPLA